MENESFTNNATEIEHHRQFLIETINLARESINNDGGPFAAIMVKNDKIIASGINQVTQKHDPTAHAEIQAIRNACQVLQDFELKDCILYASSEPCPMCLSAIYWTRLSKVFYINSCDQASNAGFDDSFIYQEINLAHEEKQIKFVKVNDQDISVKGSEIFSLWLNKKDKIEY